MLVLFDIDGTLVLTGRAGARGMNVAFEKIYGRRGALDEVPLAGRTDRAIVVDAMARLGIDPTDAALHQLREEYIDQLRTAIVQPIEGHPMTVLPGVSSLLDRLVGFTGVTTGLLTGNFHEAAAVKLGHFGLWDRFPFGAFGDDHVDRRALVPVAMARAREGRGGVTDPADVIVIGDTPLDIDCAHANGARALGVATGPFDRAALEAAGADLAVETLDPVDDVLDWLLAARAQRA